MEKDNKIWTEVNVQKLSVCLAEDKFNEDTIKVPMADKYEDVLVEKDGKMVLTKQLHSKWSHMFWNMVQEYEKLVMGFAREQPE